VAREFLLDYEIDEDEWGSKKRPWRYRWPDDLRDEVLARLLELNAERAAAEKRSGAAASSRRGGPTAGLGAASRTTQASSHEFSHAASTPRQ
jgi:hypothetical protein